MPSRESPRIRRLRSDLRSLQQLADESTILEFSTVGQPADFYRIIFRGKGIWMPENSTDVLIQHHHEVTIKLGASYPRLMPELAWQTPIYHPNISASGVVCLGGYGSHWVPSVGLDELVVMLWDMVRYQNYDIDSPYNREAAAWARSQTEFYLPTDNRPLRDLVASGQVEAGGKKSSGGGDVTFLDTGGSDEIIDAEIIDIIEADSDSNIMFIE